MNLRLPLACGALAAALALSACASPAPVVENDDSAAPPSASAQPESQAPDAPATPSAEASAPPAEPLSCDTLIGEDVIASFEAEGWTHEEREFRIAGIHITEGLECMWGDFSTPSDHVQLFGWGAIDAKTANAAMAGLQDEGWIRSSQGDSTFYTEDPAYALEVDEDGFGWTYEFGDGWVRFADTKQGLLLIEYHR